MPITWLHDEMLSPAWLREGVPTLFVFDEEWIARERLSLKRIVFLYECLLELPGVEIRKGDVVTEVRAFAERHHADTIQTARCPLPRIKRQGEELGAQWLDPEPFVELPGRVDLKRFSRYWRKAEKHVIG
ncbi:hypothetical protein [Botrimarina sp.]|uniref:hypothetical protein n=1 Tax=Botrimarina sp. TaxID=2795802 RepID=UPI0032ED86A4